MSTLLKKYEQNIITDSSNAQVREMIEGQMKKNEAMFKASFAIYDREKIQYVDSAGNVVITGQSALEKHVQSSATKKQPIFVKPAVLVDGSFEGGGAKGLSYMGAIHALAHCGIWFKRLSGTSAGSIAATLIAAGYQVDLNYRLDLLVSPRDLTPSKNNSLNQIMFEDNFARLADFNPKDDPKAEGSWTAKQIDAMLDLIPLVKQFREFDQMVQDAPLPSFYEDIKRKLGVKLFDDFIKDFRKQIINHFDLVEPEKWGSEILKQLLSLKDDPIRTRRGGLDPGSLREAMRGILRLAEKGGFFTGDVLRDWIDAHLRAKIGPGSGPNNRILFKDLPLPLAVVATDVGVPGDPADPSTSQAVVFSQKSTPDYVVAEAVRRSVSLPFAFYPLKINEGNGNNPDDIVAQQVTNQSPILTEFVDRFALEIRGTNKPITLVDNKQHHNHILMDGGFRVNLPVGVFRDKYNLYMDDNYNSHGDPVNFLFAFNLDDLSQAPPRPFGLPPLEMPDPGKSLLEVGGFVGSRLAELLPDSDAPFVPSEGIRRLMLAVGQVQDFGFGGRQEQEITTLLASVPKLIPVNIPMIDPDADKGGSRIGGLDFGIPKSTKKWWSHNSWTAVSRGLSDVSTKTGVNVGVKTMPSPYGQVLKITPIKPNNMTVMQFEHYFFPAPYDDLNGVTLHISLSGTGIKDTLYSANLIQTLHADRANASVKALEFTVSTPVRVTVLIETVSGYAPGFLANWVNPSWSFKLAIPGTTSRGQVTPARTVPLTARYKDFPSGTISLDGARAGTSNGNSYNYVVFVTPR